MSFTDILSQLPLNLRSTIRKIEKTTNKISSCNTAVTFNNTCLRENLLPRYTHLHLHDQAAQRARCTTAFRRNLVEIQLQNKKEELELLRQELRALNAEWEAADVEPLLRDSINVALEDLTERHHASCLRRTQKKLADLNGGNLKVARPKAGYINLSDYQPSPTQEDLLNLGLNCHVLSKPRPYDKRLEIEVLLENAQELEKDGKIKTTGQRLQADLLAESSKRRGHYKSTLLTKEHIEAAKQLKKEPSITIRKADKTAAYVILPTEEYLQKLDVILADESKFTRVSRNPTEDLKKKVNRVVEAVNAKAGGIKLNKLCGDYGLGYIYGNVKTHKPQNPLRPIISQIPTPTYMLAKKLNDILTPFIPNRYGLSSTKDFLDLIGNAPTDGIIASLDVESLFTNVPVDTTIDFILDRVYTDDSTPKLDIPREALKTLLELCTKEAPFISPRGHMYLQTDGVAMGSPLGVLFANFFMGTIEEKVFLEREKPQIYCRYVDDTFVLVRDEQELSDLRQRFEEVSGLSFTTELSSEGSLPFLDVLLRVEGDHFDTSVYIKKTNTGMCLNGQSECPQRYLDTTIGAYIRRALSHCNTWRATHHEIDRATQMLVDNGYSYNNVTRVTKKILDKWYAEHDISPSNTSPSNPIKLYYRSHMSSSYKTDERVMKEIIKKNIAAVDPQQHISFIIYYKPRKTSHLLLKNNSNPPPAPLQRSHLIYQYQCHNEGCEPHSTYIGMTATRLSRRLTCHLQNGAPKHHHLTLHNTHLNRQQLEKGTTILAYQNDTRRLAILEALFIKEYSPSMNLQSHDLLTLPTARTMPSPGERRFPTDDVTNEDRARTRPSLNP